LKNRSWSIIIVLTLLTGIVYIGWPHIYPFKSRVTTVQNDDHSKPVPVELAAVTQGTIHQKLIFTGTLEARAEFVVAPKVGGRIRSLDVDLSDSVKKGQLIAEMDDDEAFQAVLQAKADLAVAKATQIQTESDLTIAIREFERAARLRKKGIASDSQYDSAMASLQVKQSLVAVAKAQVMRANSLLEAAHIRLGYTRVTADWPGNDENRLVAQRYVDAGQTVSANTPLVLISKLEPITGIVHATEKDYASLSPGLSVTLTTDAYPGDVFQGKVDRISPVFDQATRQARIELAITNPDIKLKPGMFIRAIVDVRSIPNATLVPEMAITSQNDQTGVFMVNKTDLSVSWCPVTTGITEEGLVQVQGEGLSGRVVTLGQHLLNHGSVISIPDKPRNYLPDILGKGQ